MEAKENLITQNLPWGHARFLKKFGLDLFSRFDVYWIQTNRQTDKPNLYIDVNERCIKLKCMVYSYLYQARTQDFRQGGGESFRANCEKNCAPPGRFPPPLSLKMLLYLV